MMLFLLGNDVGMLDTKPTSPLRCLINCGSRKCHLKATLALSFFYREASKDQKEEAPTSGERGPGATKR